MSATEVRTLDSTGEPVAVSHLAELLLELLAEPPLQLVQTSAPAPEHEQSRPVPSVV